MIILASFRPRFSMKIRRPEPDRPAHERDPTQELQTLEARGDRSLIELEAHEDRISRSRRRVAKVVFGDGEEDFGDM
eukprot:SAG31_NODE_4863_length_2901_cov_1.189507_3_plen_77_part_00